MLGNTGWRVSVIGFGGWGIGGQWGPVEENSALAAVRAAADAGGNFFDTADAYGEPPGLSEELMGRALQPIRAKVYIATKVGNWARRLGHALSYNNPYDIYLCCDASLHRLKTDYIDLYQCHLGDLRKPDVFLEAFGQLVQRGKIRAFGLSTNLLEPLRAFNRDGRCAAVQLDYSFLNRSAEGDLLPYCQQHNLGVIVRGPLAKGICTGKFTRETRFTDSIRGDWNQGPGRERFLRLLETTEKLRFLEQPGRSLAQAALQFVISHPGVTVAIPGAKNAEQARANAAAGDAILDAQELADIHAATRA
jgi:aryl-alcohol dehydrogenase-like predicted oxidoreductase